MPPAKKPNKEKPENKEKKKDAGSKPAGVPSTKGKKGGKGKKKGKKAKKVIDYADEAHFDANTALVYVDHTDECPIFKTKATDFLKVLETSMPEKKFILLRNQGGPAADGAFEIYLAQNARTPKELIWSGINKGPPRKEKFPALFEDILPEVTNVLNKLYMTESPAEDDKPATMDILLDDDIGGETSTELESASTEPVQETKDGDEVKQPKNEDEAKESKKVDKAKESEEKESKKDKGAKESKKAGKKPKKNEKDTAGGVESKRKSAGAEKTRQQAKKKNTIKKTTEECSLIDCKTKEESSNETKLKKASIASPTIKRNSNSNSTKTGSKSVTHKTVSFANPDLGTPSMKKTNKGLLDAISEKPLD